MDKSTRQYVFEGMELLPNALTKFVEKQLDSALTGYWQEKTTERVKGLKFDSDGKIAWDQYTLLIAMDRFWLEAFKTVLGRTERSIVNELLDVRNKLAHNESFSYDDAERALDSMRRLLEAIGAKAPAEQLTNMRISILRTRFRERQRNEERRKIPFSIKPLYGSSPWREIVEPHLDVQTGNFQLAEFAADLGKVHSGSAPSEYMNPIEFFGRTYLTEGLVALLTGAAKRLSGNGGDPVVEIKTSFGGGKTHSMLALYHMTGGTPITDIPGLDQIFSDHNIELPNNINRAVLVGTSRGPEDPLPLNGRKINTTWGELAWQLGGEEAFDIVANADAKGIAPGSNLLEKIFNEFSPSLILIDEWVAYLRQIYKNDGLASGSFDSNISFVQSLTEAVKASPCTLLVAALPASQIEVGGEGGQEALDRLKQTFSRVESSWRPASQEESYEIVRRRLFKVIPGEKSHLQDNTVKQFAKLYRDNADAFPRGSAEEDYRRKLGNAFPVHPELFDQLYNGWGTLETFQRTRGVLRLMAKVVHELWMNDDPSLMIMPGSIEIGSSDVGPELRRYLQENWESIIAGDVDGPRSIPYEIDRSNPSLKTSSATRRIARAIFMGTAPLHQQKNKGLDDKQINLAVVQPGERPVTFGDALRRLGNRAKFMHTDVGRYWYSISPNLNRLATDRAEQIESALALVEIEKLLSDFVDSLRDRGHFEFVQVAPRDSADVPDEASGPRAVVLGIAHPHNEKERETSIALKLVKNILSNRGDKPRVFQNVLVFLAADSKQIEDLEKAEKNALAWSEIIRDKIDLDLTQSSVALAEAKLAEANQTVKARLKEAWCYLIYPNQDDAGAEIQLISGRLPAHDNLLQRASERLEDEGGIMPKLGPVTLEAKLNKYIWENKNHLLLNDLWHYLNRFIYLPRLKSRAVLVKTVSEAITGHEPGPFAYAESWDEENRTYQGLFIKDAVNVNVVVDRASLIVRSDIADSHRQQVEQIDKEKTEKEEKEKEETEKEKPTRFFGTVQLSTDRPAHSFNQIIKNVVDHLTDDDNEVTLTLEIEGKIPSGLDQDKIRILVENTKSLKFIETKF